MQILDFFNSLESNFNTEDLSIQYSKREPVRHVIVDNFLPSNFFKEICNEFKSFPEENWIYKQLTNSGIRKESRNFNSSPAIQMLMMQLTSHNFVAWMNKIANTTETIPDPHFLGAGITSQPAGSYLGLHIDFNWNDTLKLNRKFNLLIYVNETWDNNWNGQLEFWNKDSTECVLSVDPLPNRLIFWEYEKDLIHGVSKPLVCPSGVERQNVMAIYYYSNATPTSQPHKSLFY